MRHPTRRLKSVARQVNEKTPYGEVDLPYTGLEDIQSWTGHRAGGGDARPDGVVSLFRTGDVLFGKLRPYLAKVLLADADGACSTEALVLRCGREFWPPFLRYVLLDHVFISKVNAATFGAKMPRASWDNIGTISIACPSLDVQRRIASRLDQQVSILDELVAKKRALLRALTDRAKTAIDDAIAGNGDAPPRHSSFARRYQGGIHAGTTLTPLKYLVDPSRPVMYGIVLPGPHVEGGIPIVKGGDVKPARLRVDRLSRTTSEIEAAYARARLKEGDLLISIRGGIGDVEIVPSDLEGANITQDVARIAPGRGVSGPWLRYALQSRSVFAFLEAGSTGAAVRGLNIFDLDRTPVPTPPYEVQVEIAQRLDVICEKIKRLSTLTREHLDLLLLRRQALISGYVSGEIQSLVERDVLYATAGECV